MELYWYGSYRNRFANDVFTYAICRYQEWVYQRCVDASRELNAAEMYSEHVHLNHLDLAFCSSRCVPWRKHVRTVFNNCFPISPREYLIAERVDWRQGLARLYHSTVHYNMERISAFSVTFDAFNRELLPQYEIAVFKEISKKDKDERKLIVSKYLRAHAIFETDRFIAMYRFLLQLCTDPPLDCELTVQMLRTMCDTEIKRRLALDMASDVKSLEVLICHARDMRFDFWGMWSGNGPLLYSFDFLFLTVYVGLKHEYMWTLLKYGFPYLVNHQEFKSRCSRLRYLMFDQGRVVRTVNPITRAAMRGQVTKMMLIADTFMIFGVFDMAGDIDVRVRTLVYVTRTLPNPYVTPSELYGTMRRVVEPSYIPNLQTLVHNYATADIFEQEYEEPSPRRLMHLCRVVIRKRLAENFKLLDGIQDLLIPQSLKRYLALQQ